MARQVLPIVGAVVGAYFGGPAGAQAGYAIGSLIGNAVDPLVINGPKIGDNGVQTSAEGAIRPVVYGTGPVVGNVISRGNRQVKKKKQRQGKGGPVTVTEHVYWTYAIRICEGPIAAVTRIWEDEKLVYDIRPGSPIPGESAQYAELFSLYLGDETQLPDPDLEVFLGMGNVNAYRGTAYIVFPNYDLTDRRESIPNYRFEVATDIESAGGVTPWEYVQELGQNMMDLAAGPDGMVAVGLGDGTQSEIWITDSTAAVFTKIPDSEIPTGYNLRSVATNGSGKWVARRDFSNVLTSTNRTSWTDHTTNNSDAYLVTMWSGDRFVCIGFGGDCEWSIDGETSWTNNGLPIAAAVRNAVKASGNTVVVFSDNGDIYRNTGGGAGAWSASPVTSDPHPNEPFTGCDYDPVNGVIRAYKASTLRAYYSTDNGATFLVEAAALPANTYNGKDVGFIDGRWIGAAISPNDDYPRLFGAENGISGWEEETIDGGINAIGFSTGITRIVNNQIGMAAALGFSDDMGFIYRNNYADATTELGNPVPLADIVSAVHDRARQPSSKFDVSELDDLVDGVVLQADFSCADAIRAILPPYFADSSEYNGKIWYPKRGKPVVKTLTIDDLVDEPEDSTRDSAIEYPRKLHMFFMNPLIGYAPAKATATRSSPDVRVIGERTVQIPVVVDDVDEAAQIVDKLMKIAWAEAQGETILTVTDEHMDLVNADCVGVLLRGQVSRRRIVSIEDNPGTRKLTLRNDRQSAVTSNVTGVPLPPPLPPRPSIAGLTISEFLDIPALTDLDDDLHYLVAATGQTEAWSGALVQRSLDLGANYDDAAEFNGNTAMGVLLEEVAEASEHYTDTTNVVRVQLYVPDEIDSLTNAQFLSRGGGFALEKEDGTWEVMQYRDATDEGDNIVALSHLLRGRLNSGSAAHAVGRRFVLFDLLRKVSAVTAWIDADLTHRAISFNTSPESAIPYTDTYTAKSQTEFPVASFSLDHTGDTLTGTIVPRHRFGTEDNPVRSLNWVGYEIEASAAGDVQTIVQTSDNFSIDVTGWASPITVIVTQVNRFTGEGPSVTEEIA